MSWEIVIISGGQTGAARAALDFAVEQGIPYGGWCPKGRAALDGPLDEKYQLRETPSEEYSERTGWNLRDSDALVVFTLAEAPTVSCKQTLTMAKKLKKPSVHFHRGILAVSEKLMHFLQKHQVKRLNITGSSEADEPGVYDWVLATLKKTQTTIERETLFPNQTRNQYSRR